jgi:hypothetical protein
MSRRGLILLDGSCNRGGFSCLASCLAMRCGAERFLFALHRDRQLRGEREQKEGGKRRKTAGKEGSSTGKRLVLASYRRPQRISAVLFPWCLFRASF